MTSAIGFSLFLPGLDIPEAGPPYVRFSVRPVVGGNRCRNGTTNKGWDIGGSAEMISA
ncbi:hypothetical protein [Streptomyces sp. NPDC001744]|uniref:hypothetical protein n=1 Tax=Streptomyces sp. NPDC001744 TaxID=3364606 RepID=UPI0036D146AA